MGSNLEKRSPPSGLLQYSIGSLLIATTGVAFLAALLRFVGPPMLLLLPSVVGALMFFYGDRARSGRVGVDNALKVIGLLIFLFSPVLGLIFLPLLRFWTENG